MTARRARAKAGTPCAHRPLLMDGGRVFMDWRSHPTDRTSGPCCICRGATILRDCTGARCHKVCAEAEFARDLALAASTYRRRA